MLRSVLQEELTPVHNQLDGIDQRLGGMDKRFETIDQRFDGIDQRLDGMDDRFENIDHQLVGMYKRFDGIDERLDKIENDVHDLKLGQEELQKNIIEHLGEFTEKIAQHVEGRTYALNKRVFDIETVIYRLIS